MAKFLIVGVKGEANLWLVDCERRTVEPIEPGTVGGTNASDADLIANTSLARAEGFVITRGVDFAIAAESRADVATLGRFAPASVGLRAAVAEITVGSRSSEVLRQASGGAEPSREHVEVSELHHAVA